MGIGGDPGQNAAVASGAPYSFRASPVPWLIGMLVVGVLWLRFVHWSGR
jgi:hypothetical protein